MCLQLQVKQQASRGQTTTTATLTRKRPRPSPTFGPLRDDHGNRSHKVDGELDPHDTRQSTVDTAGEIDDQFDQGRATQTRQLRGHDPNEANRPGDGSPRRGLDYNPTHRPRPRKRRMKSREKR